MLKLTVREDPLPELYDALAEAMEAVCCKAAYIDDLRRFKWRLLNALGVAPDLHADGTGGDILADKTYQLMPEEAVMPVCEDADALSHEAGAIVERQSLIDLREGSFRTAESLQQALKITRLFIRHLLPEGLKSRQVLEQIRQFDRKETAQETVPTSDGTASNAISRRNKRKDYAFRCQHRPHRYRPQCARHDLSQPRGGGTGCRNARCGFDYHAPARRPPPHQRRGCVCRQNAIRTRLNLEMALTEEMLENALKVMPEDVCIVPEKRQKSRPKAAWTYWRNRKKSPGSPKS